MRAGEYRLADPKDAIIHADDTEPPKKVVIRQIERLRTEWQIVPTARNRHLFEDEVEERREIGRGVVRRAFCDTVAPDRKDHGKIKLLVRRTELRKKVEHLVMCPIDIRRRFIDLVQDHDRPVAELQRLFENEPRLWHRPFLCIDHEEHAVYRPQHPLDLGAEIRVARRINDVDLGVLVGARSVLGVDGDTALLLKRIAVHRHTLGHRAGLAQDGVGQRGLAMIDMGYDSNVADLHRARIMPQIRCGSNDAVRTNRYTARAASSAVVTPASILVAASILSVSIPFCIA